MSSLQKITKILTITLVILSILLLARFLYYEYNLLNYPYQWTVQETSQLNHAIILSEGKPLYVINKEPPLLIEPYGPVYPGLVAPLVKIFGKTLFAPRLVSFVSFSLILLLIAYVIFSLTHNWKFVFLSIGLNIFTLDWWQWLLICRPDGFGNFLLFLILFIHWKFPYKKTAVFLTLLIGVLAFFTKVYFVYGFGSIVLSYWFVHKDKKMALSYLSYSSVLIIAAVLIINYVTNGIYHLFTFDLMHYWTEYSLGHVFINLRALLNYYFPIFALIIYALLGGSFNFRRYGIFFIHLLISLPLFSFFLLNPGGNLFYWYPVITVLVLIGSDLIYTESKVQNNRFLILILLAVAYLMVYKVGYEDIILKRFVVPSAQLAQKWEPIDELVKGTEGHVMNNYATAILNIRAGKKLYTEVMRPLKNINYLKNRYNYSFVDIKKEVAQKKFALIINPEKALIPAVEKYYKPYKTYVIPVNFGHWLKYPVRIYVPRDNIQQTIDGG